MIGGKRKYQKIIENIDNKIEKLDTIENKIDGISVGSGGEGLSELVKNVDNINANVLTVADDTSKLTTKLNTIDTNLETCKKQITTNDSNNPTLKDQINSIHTSISVDGPGTLYREVSNITHFTEDTPFKIILDSIKTKVDSITCSESSGTVDLSPILQINTDSTFKTYLTNCNNAAGIINSTDANSWDTLIKTFYNSTSWDDNNILIIKIAEIKSEHVFIQQKLDDIMDKLNQILNLT